jgi:hypothetical protein
VASVLAGLSARKIAIVGLSKGSWPLKPLRHCERRRRCGASSLTEIEIAIE